LIFGSLLPQLVWGIFLVAEDGFAPPTLPADVLGL